MHTKDLQTLIKFDLNQLAMLIEQHTPARHLGNQLYCAPKDFILIGQLSPDQVPGFDHGRINADARIWLGIDRNDNISCVIMYPNGTPMSSLCFLECLPVGSFRLAQETSQQIADPDLAQQVLHSMLSCRVELLILASLPPAERQQMIEAKAG